MSILAPLQVGDHVTHSCEILEILPWSTYTLLDLVTGEIFQVSSRTDFAKHSQGLKALSAT